MIEDYEKRIEEIEDEYKLIFKNEKDESNKKSEVLKNQIKCIQSGLKVEQMAKKQLEVENMTLKQKLRDKETEILLIIQEVNILKT